MGIVRLGSLCKDCDMGRFSNIHWLFEESSRVRIEGIPSTDSFEDLVLSVGVEMAKTSDDDLKNALRYVNQEVKRFRDAVSSRKLTYLTERMRLLTSTKDETKRGGDDAIWSEFGLVSLNEMGQHIVDTLPISEEYPLLESGSFTYQPHEETRDVKMYITCAAPHEVTKSEGSGCTIA